MPASSIARRIAARLFAVGVRRAVSKSRTVLSDMLARFGSSVCDQPSHTLAARHCSGLMPRQPGVADTKDGKDGKDGKGIPLTAANNE
jgi:hypothetical protein